MKNLFYIVVILFVVSCKNTTKNISSKKAINTDTVTTAEFPEMKADTLTKISEPFNINGIKCNWKQIDSPEGKTTLELKDYTTQRILLSYSDYFKTENDFNSEDYFNEHFQDLNFDGFKDFLMTSYGSNEMTNLVNIYVFNEKTKSFEFSEDLSDNQIEAIDTINRKLVTSSSSRDNEIKKNHYFDKNGQLKYLETITKSDSIVNDTINIYRNIYEKSINGKVVKTKEYITTE
ncbi:XAC2610-related protein [uncultured Flavobacterium sp.]|uniref:XAC2610-related protein n=1 Tax=uncultured Flavobacterium sp. TaxID=165435 RepID=UPI00292F162E|nr:hypothetical protein [uncultured Flavobacterium sp.]